MATTEVAERIYEESVKNLSTIERLRLVKLVMDDLMSGPTTWIVDESDAWTDEDYADLTRASLAYADRALEERGKAYRLLRNLVQDCSFVHPDVSLATLLLRTFC